MSLRAEPPRYEIKIPCALHLLPQVQAWVRLHLAHWRIAHPPRQVNNIYFDTADCRMLNENLSGVGERGKLRLRWYGPDLQTVVGARLELKYREGTVGWKDVRPLDVTLDLSRLSWPEIYRTLCEVLCEAADTRFALLLAQFSYPVLINCYQRAYYVTADQAVRLTLDTGLRAYDQRYSHRPNLSRVAPMTEHVVVELKAAADRASYARLAEAVARFPLRPDRHSKYVHGMVAAPDYEGVMP